MTQHSDIQFPPIGDDVDDATATRMRDYARQAVMLDRQRHAPREVPIIDAHVIGDVPSPARIARLTGRGTER